MAGVSPFVATLALAQNAHFHGHVPEPLIAWLFHVNTLTIAVAGLFGGLLQVVLSPPKSLQDALARVFFAVGSSVMLIPWVVESFFKDASISAVMAFAGLGAMCSQTLVPIILKIFQAKAEMILVEKTTTTLVEKKEVQQIPKPDEKQGDK